MIRHFALLVIGTVFIAGCNRQQPPRSSTEFVDNPRLLEAAMVRCARDREQSRYDAECLNARAAAERIQVKAEAEGQAELEEQSTRKRKELRRTQAAALKDAGACLRMQRAARRRSTWRNSVNRRRPIRRRRLMRLPVTRRAPLFQKPRSLISLQRHWAQTSRRFVKSCSGERKRAVTSQAPSASNARANRAAEMESQSR